jgi:hypothetical protein
LPHVLNPHTWTIIAADITIRHQSTFRRRAGPCAILKRHGILACSVTFASNGAIDPMEPVITGHIDWQRGLRYTRLMAECFDAILEKDHFLPDWILSMEGMSGRRYRQFINLLASKMAPTRYLEIGAWQGSTLCATLWNNRISATVCDDWSQFGGPRDQFLRNLQAVRGTSDVTVIEQDFRTINYHGIGRFNLYMFDGPHEEQDQYDGIVLAMPAMDEEFIMVVDDWNHPYVKSGTLRAIDDLGLVVDSIRIETSSDGSHPSPAFQHSDWHNGYFIASVRKPG